MNSEIKHVYEQMQEEIQLPKRNFCGSEGKTGDLCLVSVDEKWHRARIVSMQDEKYEVFLIDRAQHHSTTSEALAWGKDESFILPPEIESCVLANVLSVETNWPERAANFLRSLPGKEFKGLVQHALMPDRTILLDLPTISKHLCKEGVAKKVPVGEFKNLVLKCLNLPEEDAIEPMTTDQSLNACNQLENGDHYFYPELFTNTFESIRVTEVIDPGNIFCEVAIFAKAIKILTDQMNEEVKDKSGSEDSQPHTIGMPCAAKGVDGKWRRAVLKQQITSNDASVDVFFVDEGKHELVQTTDIKKLDDRFLRMPVVTYHCSLEGVRKDKEWAKEEIDRLKSLVLNQNIVARFERHILPEDSYSVSLYTPNAACINDYFLEKKDIEMNADAKQTFTNKLILNGAAHEVASPSFFPKSLEQDSFTQNYSSPFSPMEMPLCDLLTIGASVGVKISCIDSASKFWCQTSLCDKKLDVLMKDLQAHYASVHPKPLVESICVARNPDNNMWYRAKIIANQLSPDVEVRFIDYGQTKKVPLRELRPIDPTFLRLDAQAFQCSLFDLPATDANYATEEFHKFVDSCLAQNSGLKCVIKAVASDEEGMLLNMVDLQTQSESASQVLAEKLAARPETYIQSSHNIEVNSTEKISISYSETVHSFYGQLDRNSQLFQQVQSDIEKIVTSSVPSDCQLAPNSLCIARYSDSNWYRGRVLETLPDFKVHFVDLGRTLALNKADIRPFPREASAVRAIPILAVPMGLFNIPEEIPQEINEWFAEKAAGYTFTMTVIEKSQDGMLMVELVDGSNSLNAQVREKIVDIQVENKHLCNVSKIAPVSNMEIDECQSEVAQQNSSPKFKNGGLGMEDWILVDFEPQNGTAVKESPEEIIETIAEQTSAMEIDDENKPLPPNKITASSYKILSNSAYKKPILSFNKTQELHASSISSPDFFWCQCSNTGDLDKVTRLAQIEGKVAQDPFFPLLLLSGHPCLALYKSDNQWYRAQVIRKNQKTFSVVFVDYGNEEDIDYKDVRPLSASLLEVAPQAFLCSLDDTDGTEDKWDDVFFDKFYNALVDKPLKVKVLRMEQNSEVQMPQYTVQIDDAGLHKLLQKYGISIVGDAMNKNPKREMFSNPNILVNKTVKVYASSISGPGYFWCQYTNTGELDRVTKLAQKSGWAGDPLFPETLAPGSPCLALYSTDKQWYRAQVISRKKDKFNVVFVDYGNEEKIRIFNVRPMPPRLMEIQPQAFLCRLENFDDDTTTWDDALYDAFHDLLLDKIIKLTILDMKHNEEVKVPQYTVQFDFDVEKFCRQYVPKPVPSILQTVSQNVQNASQDTPAKAPEVNLKTCKYNKPQLAMNKTVMAYASSISGPEYFWCQYRDTAELNEIDRLAQNEGRTQHDPNFANNLIPGSPCLALFSDDNVWYRAQILSKSQDKFSVLFIDYGNEADVTVKNVRPMSSRLLEALPQGFLCCLEGFDLTKGAWDDKVYDHFYSLLVDNLLTVTPSCSVENPDTKLPQFVVQIQCRSMAVNKAMLKYWKANGNIDDISSNLAQNLSISGPTNLNLSTQKAFKKPNVSLNRMEQVYASCIVDPHYFWCQFANSADLDKIVKLAQDAGRSQQCPETLDKGDLCLALFSSDDQWYRALVSKKIGEMLNMVFIDYGNEAEVAIKDTRLMPQNLLEQPPQAFLCTLHGFDRAKGTWDDQGCDDFFNSLVDRSLNVKLVAVEDNQELALPQYSVQIECEGANVNTLMEKYWRGAASQGPESSGSGEFQGV